MSFTKVEGYIVAIVVNVPLRLSTFKIGILFFVGWSLMDFTPQLQSFQNKSCYFYWIAPEILIGNSKLLELLSLLSFLSNKASKANAIHAGLILFRYGIKLISPFEVVCTIRQEKK